MPASWILEFCAAVSGLLLGSFLNVCIRRLPAGQSVVLPASHCMKCGHAIAWHDNVPVLSFLALRGRCRACAARFSPLYLVVEVAVACWFVFAVLPVALQLGLEAAPETIIFVCLHATAVAAFGFLLIGLMFMDWQTGRLPNEFTLGGLFLGLLFAGAESFWVPSVRYKTFFTPEEVFFGRRIAAAIAGYLFLTLVARLYRLVRGKPGMGRGDAKQLAMMGAFLGLQQLSLAFFLAVMGCTLFALGILVARRGNAKTALPFGTFLSLGGLVSAAAGEGMVHWYLGLFR